MGYSSILYLHKFKEFALLEMLENNYTIFEDDQNIYENNLEVQKDVGKGKIRS